jgi:hypothetical protein
MLMKFLESKGINPTEFFKEILHLVILLFTSICISVWIFRDNIQQVFSNAIPLGGDGLSTGFFLASVIKNSYFAVLTQNVTNSQFGWPGTLDYSNYPSGNVSEILAIKIFADLTGTHDPGVIMHVFSVFKFVPITFSVYFLARLLGLTRALSSIIGLSFAYSNFNYIRAEGHFFLGFTWVVPLGIATIVLAYNIFLDRRMSKVPNTRRKFDIRLIVISIVMIFVGFSSYYYSILLLILNSIILFLLLLTEFNNSKFQFNFQFIYNYLRTSFQKTVGFFLVNALLLFGLLAQTLPILYRQNRNPSLDAVGERSFVEPIVYAGSLESFFYDVNAAVLNKLDQPAILNFLGSRISWEGSQVGALTGLAVYVLFAYLIIWVSLKCVGQESRFKLNIESDQKLQFIVLLTLLSFLLYLPTPISFGISRLFPQIRAWGRVSVFITLFILLLIGMVATRIRGKGYVSGVLVASLLLIPFGEIYQHRLNRPSAIAVNDSDQAIKRELSVVLTRLKSEISSKCPISILPIYAYPEFDIPNDTSGDYARLLLPYSDEGNFIWSYPSIKSTSNWRFFENLISVQPNFVRASMTYQAYYSRELGACASIVDVNGLTEIELNEFTQMRNETFSSCIVRISGDTASEWNNYYLINYKNPKCSLERQDNIVRLIRDISESKLMWKIEQPYGLKFEENFQMFPTAQAIDFKVLNTSSNESDMSLRVKLTEPDRSIRNFPVSICVIHHSTKLEQCQILETKVELQEVDFALKLPPKSPQKYQVFLRFLDSVTPVGTWGITIK